jgi:hypothetical protein
VEHFACAACIGSWMVPVVFGMAAPGRGAPALLVLFAAFSDLCKRRCRTVRLGYCPAFNAAPFPFSPSDHPELCTTAWCARVHGCAARAGGWSRRARIGARVNEEQFSVLLLSLALMVWWPRCGPRVCFNCRVALPRACRVVKQQG